MIKALWFALRTGLLIVAAVWLADQPGDVRIQWQDFTFTLHLGFFLLLMIVTIVLGIFIYRIIRALVDLPGAVRKYRAERRRDKGYEALTLGLTAVAAGDVKAAAAQARKTKKFLPEDTGLPLLLQAQAARLDGREEEAAQSFALLLENKNASFLGVRGLLQKALDNDDVPVALSMAEKALSLHPRQPWILKIVYDLYIRQRSWRAALEILARIEKCGALDKEQIRSDRAAILLAQAMVDHREGFLNDARDKVSLALKTVPAFVPAAIMLADLQQAGGHTRKARQIIEKTWKAAPHPALMESWEDLIDTTKADDALYRMRWMEKLFARNAASVEGCLKIARTALQAGLWGETRAYLERAHELEDRAEMHKIYAELEARTGGDSEKIRGHLQKANAALPARCWMCKQTGRIYSDWSPIAEPHGAFNTIIWDIPSAGARLVSLEKKPAEMAQALIEIPAA